ncbi:alpha/beta hydrolase family protein [Photorhabdus sp. RM71S]|uniref:alpha/beta hydrolase family protein n=1 Tax=Photorhabdus sp. RM71S TaxID=3342824 RepID=UPI0036DDC8C5
MKAYCFNLQQKILTSVLLFSCCIGFAYSNTNTHKQFFRHDGSEITYYLKQRGGKNLLVLIQGSDCNSIANNKFVNNTFSDIYPDSDVLTVEKYGINASLPWSDVVERLDCPKAYIRLDTPEQRVKDYIQIIDYLKHQNKYKKIVILGGSEGAVVANLMTSQVNYIDRTVSLNGGGRYFADDVIHSMRSEVPPEHIDEAIKGFRDFQQKIATGNNMGHIEMSNHGANWWRISLGIDQYKVLSQTKRPILIIQTLNDNSVSPGSAIKMEEQLKKDNITFYQYPGLSHGFRNSEGVLQITPIVEDIKNWLSRDYG